MLLSALPNELLADILDRLDPRSVIQCTKLNKRFNIIIKTYNLFKPAVVNLLSIRWLNENGQQTNIVEIIAKTVNEKRKFEVKTLISVEEKSKTEEIEEKIIAVLKKFGVLSTRIFETNSDELNFDRILRDSNINLSQLQCFLLNEKQIPRQISLIDNFTLENLVKNKTTNVYMNHLTTNITIDGILTAIQELSTFSDKFTWNLGAIQTSREEINELFVKLENRTSLIEGDIMYNRFFFKGVTLTKTNSTIQFTFKY